MRPAFHLVALLSVASCTSARAITPDLARVAEPSSWTVLNGEHRISVEDGMTVLQLAPIGGNRPGSNVALALVDADFSEGTIEVNLRAQGREGQSFLGVAFGALDAGAHEAVYFRPFNFRSDDPARRAHSVQYVAWPDGTWEALRKQSPGKYEAALEPPPDPAAWFHARVDVTSKEVRVFVNEAKSPCLVVSRLRTEKGKVGLWVDSQPGMFTGLTIRAVR
jgi:hypothetical protein